MCFPMFPFLLVGIPSYLNLCRFQCFICCFCYNLLSKSMLFPMFPLFFCYGFLSNLCLFQCFLCCFRYTFLSKSMFCFQCFLCCFRYTFLSKSISFSHISFVVFDIPSYLNLCISNVSFAVFVITSYLNLFHFPILPLLFLLYLPI